MLPVSDSAAHKGSGRAARPTAKTNAATVNRRRNTFICLLPPQSEKPTGLPEGTRCATRIVPGATAVKLWLQCDNVGLGTSRLDRRSHYYPTSCSESCGNLDRSRPSGPPEPESVGGNAEEDEAQAEERLLRGLDEAVEEEVGGGGHEQALRPGVAPRAIGPRVIRSPPAQHDHGCGAQAVEGPLRENHHVGDVVELADAERRADQDHDGGP